MDPAGTLVAAVSDQLLFVLKLCLLALLYLFFFRVVRAVWAEIRTPATAGPAPAATPTKGNRRRRAEQARQARRTAARVPQLVVVEPAAGRGTKVPLSGELTIGRAAGCQLSLDDAYASQIHARLFCRDGHWMVEDLGSTNGTYLNGRRVSGAAVIARGDRLQVGNTVMELR